MRIIHGAGAVLGRLAAFVAKEALKGEEISVVNCKEIIITGRKENIQKKFEEKRQKVGSAQKGPKHSRLTHLLVKRTIRGMLPNPREGRGKQALKRIKCYSGIPKELEGKKVEELKKIKRTKFIEVKEISK